MNITRTLIPLLLAGSTIGVFAVAPSASAQEKVCVHRSLQLRDHRSEGNTEYFYFEEVCDGWMDTSGPADPAPPKGDGTGGGNGPMSREDECDSRAEELNRMEDELRWAQDNVLFLEAGVRKYDAEETNASRTEAEAAANALAADVALADAQAAYVTAGYSTTRTRLIKGEEVEFAVGYDINTPQGRAVVTAQAVQRAAAAKLAAAHIDRWASGQTSASEASMRTQLDGARSILATYPMRIEQLRREFRDRC